jgi:hypothetical protein
MATNRENYVARLAAVTKKIAELSAANIDLPDNSQEGNQFVAKIKALYEEAATLNDLINIEDGGFCIPSELDLE